MIRRELMFVAGMVALQVVLHRPDFANAQAAGGGFQPVAVPSSPAPAAATSPAFTPAPASRTPVAPVTPSAVAPAPVAPSSRAPALTTQTPTAPAPAAAAAGTLPRIQPVAPTATPGAANPGAAQPAAARTPPMGKRLDGDLPNKSGQVLREYPIASYTSRVASTSKPEQAIVDWVLRETGHAVWFSEPLGFMNANRDRLLVYHTEDMHKIVADVVDRFVASQAESYVMGVRLMTVSSPNWRSRAHSMLQPVNVQTPGIDAWLLSKEHAALLIGELSRRSDYQEHSAPNLVIQNGQSQTLSRMQPRTFVKNVRMKPGSWPGHELEMGKVDSGYSFQISPLYSPDNRVVDAAIKVNVDQVEKFVPLSVEVPQADGQRQSIQVQVPQMASYRLHERFRWPTDKVLLISAGVGPTPGPEKPNALGITIPFTTPAAPRADGLLFIECRGKASQNRVDGAAVRASTARGF